MKTATILIAVILTGCANFQDAGTGSNYTPIVDQPGASYQRDLADCQQHADRVMSAGQSAVAGAIGGALMGALLGRAMGGGDLSNYGMKVGALSGATGAAAGAEMNQRTIISKCLAGRGHRVLN